MRYNFSSKTPAVKRLNH